MKIKTGFSASDKKAKEILDSVIGQLSDGIWENSNAMNKYWQNLDTDIDNGEIIIIVKDGYGTPYNELNPDDRAKKISDFFANKIKQIVKIEKDDDYTSDARNIEWKRDCEAVTEYMGYDEKITVKDCYRVYDKLKGRKDRIKESKKLRESAPINKSMDDIIKEAHIAINEFLSKMDELFFDLDKNFHNVAWRRVADSDTAMKLMDILTGLKTGKVLKLRDELLELANEGYHRG